MKAATAIVAGLFLLLASSFLAAEGSSIEWKASDSELENIIKSASEMKKAEDVKAFAYELSDEAASKKSHSRNLAFFVFPLALLCILPIGAFLARKRRKESIG